MELSPDPKFQRLQFLEQLTKMIISELDPTGLGALVAAGPAVFVKHCERFEQHIGFTHEEYLRVFQYLKDQHELYKLKGTLAIPGVQ